MLARRVARLMLYVVGYSREVVAKCRSSVAAGIVVRIGEKGAFWDGTYLEERKKDIEVGL